MQDFESYLRTVVALVEDDIRFVLDEYTSNFITYDLPIGIYTFEDNSEFSALNIQRESDLSESINIEVDDSSWKLNWF